MSNIFCTVLLSMSLTSPQLFGSAFEHPAAELMDPQADVVLPPGIPSLTISSGMPTLKSSFWELHRQLAECPSAQSPRLEV